MVFLALVTACSSRPLPTVVEQNYQSGERIRQVRVGGDYYWAFTLAEPEPQARERLMAEVAKDCSRHRLVAEGRKENPRTEIDSDFNNVTNRTEVTSRKVTDVYLWVRYRCEQ